MQETTISPSQQEQIPHNNNEMETNDDKEEEVFCPLFMEGLPRDFATNPQLAAIASLLEESDKEEDKPKKKQENSSAPIVPRAGGGKARRSHQTSRSSRSHQPYSVPIKKKKNQHASLGEAQLFLNLWKL